MATKAVLKNVHVSPQKGRLVADLVRGLPVGRALEVLAFSPKKEARIVGRTPPISAPTWSCARG